MPPASRSLPLVALGLASLLAGCTRARRAEVAGSVAAACACEARERGADAGPATSDPVADPFLRGLAPLVARLPTLPLAERTPDGTMTIAPVRLPDAEAELLDALAPATRRTVPTFFVFGQAARLPTTPARIADAALDAATERTALDADEVVEVGRARVGVREERVLRVALLRKGEGPFRYDFRWSLRVARTDRPDGAVWLRYDLVEDAPRERVTWFTGVATLEPVGRETVVRELVSLGSDTSPPFFLKGKVRGAVHDILAKRWTVVWGAAVAGRR